MQEAGARWTQRSWTVYLHTVGDTECRAAGGEWLVGWLVVG